MSENQPKYYLTTPIYYVNARPHIGHAYTTIVADVLARRHRLLGEDTLFLTGTDEHGQKIERSAAAAGIPPQQFTDQVSAEFRTLWDRMGLTYDRFIRTTSDEHKRGAQKLFADLYHRGAIYLSSYTGQYSIGEEMFVEGPPGTLGPDGRPTETVTEENFFFRLSDYQKELIELIEPRRDGSPSRIVITPEASRNEVLNFLCGDLSQLLGEGKAWAYKRINVTEKLETAMQGGLVAKSREGTLYIPGTVRDLSVSRSSFTWGIPVPASIQGEAKVTGNHIIYVWLDALANYMTAIGYGDPSTEAQAEFARLWPADLHLVGKEITRFHCVYWPAFLLAAGLPLPKQITANGWLLFDNAKMSKSRGNIVRTETILDAFGDQVYGKQFPDSTKQERDLFATDVLRYFLLREIPFGQDGSFSFDALVTRYNADLANGYGNLVSRTLRMIARYFPEEVPELSHEAAEKVEALSKLQMTFGGRFQSAEPVIADLVELRFDRSLQGVQVLISVTDQTVSFLAPWKERESPEQTEEIRAFALSYVFEAVRITTSLLYPILPYATSKVWAQLGLGDIEAAARNGEMKNLTWGGLKSGTKLGPLAPIFPRADKGLAQIMIDMEEARNAATQTSPTSPLTPEQSPARAATNQSTLNTAPTAAPVTTNPTDPAAPPRSSSLDILTPLAEPSGTLSVGGSHAETPSLPTTPGPHTEAPASGAFASAAAQTPISSTPADAAPQIAIDDFMKVELRVAEILIAERIPKADKLLRLEVDLGYERRQILSGIAQWYTPEDLIGRRIVIVANLAPRKMRGLESHGMLLAASEGPDGKPVLATFGEGIALGARVR